MQDRRERIERYLSRVTQWGGERSLYLIGSLRNPRVPVIGNQLRELGWDVFDDWYSAGEKADDAWQAYEKQRGHSFAQALDGYAAQHTFGFDREHIERCQIGLLVLPAGKSGHLELGVMIGQGKPGFILLDGEPERYDVMYNFATQVFEGADEMLFTMKDFGR